MNPPDPGFPQALQRLELAQLQSGAHAIWYRAGFEAGRARTNAWRATTAAAILASALIFAWISRPPRPAVQIASPAASQSTAPTVPAPDNRDVSSASYARLLNSLLTQGLPPPSEPGSDVGRPDHRHHSFGPDADSVSPTGSYPIEQGD